MKRDQLRDEIRTLAGIPGDNMFDFLLNKLVDEEINKYTRLRKYPETLLLGVQLSWEDNLAGTIKYNFAKLPTDVQHLDTDNIFYDKDSAFKTNLSRWSRIYTNTTSGPAIQFRRCKYLNPHTTKYDQVLEITPSGSISYAVDSVYINYWGSTTWDENTDFPISELESVVMNNVVSRIASLQNSGLAKRADIAAQAFYIASRGTNTGDKS